VRKLVSELASQLVSEMPRGFGLGVFFLRNGYCDSGAFIGVDVMIVPLIRTMSALVAGFGDAV